MSVTDYKNNLPTEDSRVLEITPKDIVAFFKATKRVILLAALIGATLGVLYAFSKPDMYTAQVTVMPELQIKGAGGLGNLSSLAGLAGVNLDNISSSQDAIRPDLYPNVLQSVPFALELLKKPVYSPQMGSTMTLQAFIERNNNEGFVNRLFNVLSSSSDAEENKLDPKNFSQAIQVTKKQDRLIKSVQTSVAAAYDKKTSIIAITVVEQDPVVAATIARMSLEYLTNYVTIYRTEKARQQVDFLIQRVSEVQSRYRTAEYALSAYRDRNRNLFLNTAKIDEQRLQADYLLAQSVYTDLSKQLEQAKIKVQQETPVFKTLEPPQIPLKKSGPKRIVLISIFCVSSCIVTLVFLSARSLYNKSQNN